MVGRCLGLNIKDLRNLITLIESCIVLPKNDSLYAIKLIPIFILSYKGNTLSYFSLFLNENKSKFFSLYYYMPTKF
jgi:hypothetical protein